MTTNKTVWKIQKSILYLTLLFRQSIDTVLVTDTVLDTVDSIHHT